MTHYEIANDKKARFLNHFNMTDADLTYIGQLFMRYGHPDGIDTYRTKANHYYLQGIWQYCSVEYKSWKSKLSKELHAIIKEKYPQLMVQDKQFEI